MLFRIEFCDEVSNCCVNEKDFLYFKLYFFVDDIFDGWCFCFGIFCECFVEFFYVGYVVVKFYDFDLVINSVDKFGLKLICFFKVICIVRYDGDVLGVMFCKLVIYWLFNIVKFIDYKIWSVGVKVSV